MPRGVFLSAAMIVLARNVATLLGLLWIARALRRLGTSEGIAAAAAALTFFGGPLIFYSLVGMSHAPAFALAALLLLVLVRQRESGERAARPGGRGDRGRGGAGALRLDRAGGAGAGGDRGGRLARD